MDIIITLFTGIWESLDECELPIVEISIKDFLLTIIILNICFGFLNFFLGKHADSSDKGG